MDNSKYTQCNFIIPFPRTYKVKTTQTQQIKNRSAATQTLKVIAEPKKRKTRNFQTQCLVLATSDRTTQTLTLMVNDSTETDDKVTCPFEKGIFSNRNQSITTPYFQDIIERCRALGLHIRFTSKTTGNVILVTNPKSLNFFEEGIDIVQVYITESGKCTSVIPFCKIRVKQIFTIHDDSDVKVDYVYLDEVLNTLLGVNLAFCPGIISKHEFAEGLNSIERFDKPFPRLQSVSCPVLYKVDKNSKKRQCHACYVSSRTLTNRKKRKHLELSQNVNAKRTKAESNYPITFLSQTNRKIRLKNIRLKRKSLNRKVSQLESQIKHGDVHVRVKSNSETIVSLIKTETE